MNVYNTRQDLVMILEARLRQRMAEHRLGGLVYARKQAIEQLFTAKEAAAKLGIGLRTFYGFSTFLTTPSDMQLYASRRVFTHGGLQKIKDLMETTTCKGEERVIQFRTKTMPTKESHYGNRTRRASQNGSRTRR